MRFFRDSDEVTPVRWFFADEDAKYLGIYNRFSSANWSYDTPWPPDVGEDCSSARKWCNGVRPVGAVGHHHCGSDDQWAKGCFYDDALLQVGPPSQLPFCCDTPAVVSVLSFTALWRWLVSVFQGVRAVDGIFTEEGLSYLAFGVAVQLGGQTTGPWYGFWKLFQNDLVPTAATRLADMVEADFDGYAPIPAAFFGPVVPWVPSNPFTAVQNQWAATGSVTGNTIYGWYWEGVTEPGFLICAARFDVPVTIAAPGDFVSVTPTFSLVGG